jgi:selenocysteine lyase/cysteine desulfurase
MLSALNARPSDARSFAAIRAQEFGHLDDRGIVYLDYTGAAIPAASQLRAHHDIVSGSVLGNPHSENGPSRESSELIEEGRALVLEFFGADPAMYEVCFTANTSAAIKLVAESFPFGRRSSLVLSADNHNSVNGIAEFARRHEAGIVTIPLTSELKLRAPGVYLRAHASQAPSLFAFPAQSNFSGLRHPLTLVKEAQDLGYRVLLDAAAFVPSSPLNLADVSADFVVLSFYKMFGFPTGIGALIIRKDALRELERPWFAGGTVEWASVQNRAHRLRESGAGFEDGTPNYYGIAALRPGLEFLRSVGLARTSRHVTALAAKARELMATVQHRNGSAVFRTYGPHAAAEQGGTIATNLVDERGGVIPYELVERRARDHGIAIRGGCFCNPGASERAFGFRPRATARCFRRTTNAAFSPRVFAGCIGRTQPVGAIRLSFGIATTEADVAAGIDVLASIAGEAATPEVF